jgi:hypothetical protein
LNPKTFSITCKSGQVVSFISNLGKDDQLIERINDREINPYRGSKRTPLN